MGVLADIYLAHGEEAVGYDAEPERYADRAEYQGITPLELSTLWAIMRGIEWDVALMDEFPCLLQVDGGERLIHSLPPAMVEQLAGLPPDRAVAVTSAWADTEELCCDPDDIKPVVDDLMRLSRSARETDRSVHLWNCV